MNKLIAGFILLSVLGSGYLWNKHARNKFYNQSRSSTGALFILDGDRQFDCTVSVFATSPSQNYALAVTARHCVVQDAQIIDVSEPSCGTIPEHLVGPEQVSFSDNEEGPFYDVLPLYISNTDDIAILYIKNGGDLPLTPLGDESKVQDRDSLLNFTFAHDLGKMELDIKMVSNRMAHTPDEIYSGFSLWKNAMIIDGTAAPGSSGSPLFDPNQQALVGIVVGITNYGGLNYAMPVSRVWALLGDKNVQEPIPAYLTMKSLPVCPDSAVDGDINLND